MLGRRRPDHTGFTLMEMIIVMGLLATFLALTAPQLSRFFAGRSLAEEARRILALTRYARSEAISSARPMELWIDPETGTYGVWPQVGYRIDEEEIEKADLEYELDEDLEFDLGEAELDEDLRARIIFWPDGQIDEESLESLVLTNGKEDSIEILLSESGTRYRIEMIEE